MTDSALDNREIAHSGLAIVAIMPTPFSPFEANLYAELRRLSNEWSQMSNEKSIITLNGSLCCDANMEQLTNNLTSLDGVEDARGSFAADRITVSYEPESASIDDIAAEIGDAGVGVEETITVDVSDA